MSVVWLTLVTSPVVATSEAASQVIGSKGSKVAVKGVIDGALKMANSKLAMTAATTVVSLACLPVAGVGACQSRALYRVRYFNC